MKISETGIALIKSFEGYHLVAYRCPAGVWTIGYGHTANVTPTQVISAQRADELLKQDLEKHEKNVMKYNNIYHWNQNEFDAMVSFSFNLGSIDKLTANGTRDKSTIARKMLEYNKANGTVLAGLVRRRQAEYDLFGKQYPAWSDKMPLVRMGDKGVYVTRIQIELNDRGFYDGDIDGIFGKQTKAGVIKLQESLGIKPDGIVGDVTWSFIDD